MSLTGIFSALKALSKLVEVFQWAWKTFTVRKAESQHAQNETAIDAAVARARDGVHDDTGTNESRPTPPSAS